MIDGISRSRPNDNTAWGKVLIVEEEIEDISERVSKRLQRMAPMLAPVQQEDISQEMRIGVACSDFDPDRPDRKGLLYRIGYCAGLKLMFTSFSRNMRTLVGEPADASDQKPSITLSFSPCSDTDRQTALRAYIDQLNDANFLKHDATFAKVAAIERAWAEASPEEKDLIIQFYFEGRSYSELAELFDQPKNNLQKKLSRFRASVRGHFDDTFDRN